MNRELALILQAMKLTEKLANLQADSDAKDINIQQQAQKTETIQAGITNYKNLVDGVSEYTLWAIANELIRHPERFQEWSHSDRLLSEEERAEQQYRNTLRWLTSPSIAP